MENYNIRDNQGRLIDGILPEVDDDRYYYWVVIDRKDVYYASSKEEAIEVLQELMEARDEWNLEEKITEINNR